jgi:hypothetical protein
MSRIKKLLLQDEAEAKLPRELALTRQETKGTTMDTLHEFQYRNKHPRSERFATLLPHFLILLEGEWRQRQPIMTIDEQTLFRQAHRSLAGLFSMEADQ